MRFKQAIAIGFVITGTVIGISGQTAEQHLQKCDASFEKGKYSDALTECTKALEAKPGFEEALITRAGTYKTLRNYPAAIADYTELIRVSNGMAMAYFYRAGLYAKTGRNNEAVADLTSSITKDPKGLFAARSYYERGLIYDKLGKSDAAQADYWSAVKIKPDYAQAKAKIKYPFGDKTLTEAANDIVPGVNAPDNIQPAKPTPSPVATAKAIPSVLPKIVPAGVPAAWKRMVLTGTGLSVASPVPYVLKVDKPDPGLEKMTARVRWEMLDGSLWATVQYLKWDQGFTTIRQTLESMVDIVFEDPTAGAKFIKDTTFLGEPAAVIDQERYNSYSKKQVRQKMINFGTANTYVTLNFVHDAGDKAAAAKVEQIIASFKKEGEIAVDVPKLPPAIWKTFNFGGLLFDFPAQVAEGPCGQSATSKGQTVCGSWGDKDKENLTIDVSYRNYGGLTAPEVKKFAADYLDSMKQIMAKDTSWKEFKNEPYPINAGEAVKISATQAYDGTNIIFVARGTERWQVRVWHFNRWDGVRDAHKRIVASIKFKQ
ncbi:MAG: tetratricopeptide repeat protein [Chloracidobacterium sp.]|nr:tetratricopeptide repeat protein [Chloracidobacterium sp.]